ncbi:hypothetical protein MYCTH_2106114 [Thermothelomyces thermophilus ATCC 42464]|uniref:Uncharacterized protein n=1 Tax=Thermothelomyces thermophilus (strain ATCC 42464 / BCRC 31852 / DSM 1799) TaxID=573729 RepID=G2Q0W2_THET4|nr:uncharacterized protein MYCTH_2106114 [Thermothelomyces thermophilus ATCC 42464]AEO53262.1 hypothetical protein MYCTH_2106114 [Thermothelomyces thermophilus ATCC 42464]
MVTDQCLAPCILLLRMLPGSPTAYLYVKYAAVPSEGSLQYTIIVLPTGSAKDKLAKRSLLTGEITMCPPPATIPVRGGSAQRPYLRESSTSIHQLRPACFFFFGKRHPQLHNSVCRIWSGTGAAHVMMGARCRSRQLVATVAQPPRECKDAMSLRWWWSSTTPPPRQVVHTYVQFLPGRRLSGAVSNLVHTTTLFYRSEPQTRLEDGPGLARPRTTPWQSVKESKCHPPFACIKLATNIESEQAGGDLDGETNAMRGQEGAGKVGDASSSHVALQSAGVA